MPKKTHPHYSLHRTLFFMVIHAIIPLIGLVIYITLGTKSMLLKSAEFSLLDLTRIASSKFVEQVNDVNKILSTLEVIGIFDPQNPDLCNQLVRRVQVENPRFSVIGVADTKGDLYCSSYPEPPTVNIADRHYFQEAVTTGQLSSAEYLIGRVRQIPAITFGKPLFDTKDNLYAVAIASFPLDYLEKLITDIKLPENFNATLINKDGVILARYPEAMEIIGQKDATDPAIAKILTFETTSGSFVLKAHQNPSKIEKIYVFSRIDTQVNNNDIYVYVDVPVTHLTDITNQKLVADFLATAIVLIVTMIIVILDWQIYLTRCGRLQAKVCLAKPSNGK